MTDIVEQRVAPGAIERAMEVFEQFKDSSRAGAGAQVAHRTHFGLVAAGETNEQRLVVSGLAHLKSLERQVPPFPASSAK
jgi:hypothetical protein